MTEKRAEHYVSRDGFTTSRIYRGLTEIEPLLKFLYSWYKDKAFVCGGYVRYMASPNAQPIPARDIDVYCYDQETFDHLAQNLKEADLEIKYENAMAITYSRITDPEHIFFGCPQLQLIKPVKEGKIVASGGMQEILENFDFTVVRAGLFYYPEVCISDNQPSLDRYVLAMVDADFEHDETHKNLRLKNIHCPVSSMYRCIKYVGKGYWIRPMQALKLFLDWSDRDDDYRRKLVDFMALSERGEEMTQEQIDELEALMRID